MLPCRFPEYSGDALISRSHQRGIQGNNAVTPGHLNGGAKTAPNFVYQALTILGKDCEHIGQKSINAYQAGQSRHPFRIRGNHDVSPSKRQRRTSMALKVELKPHERIIIGACVITNTDQRARLLIDGDKIPILREKDILTPD